VLHLAALALSLVASVRAAEPAVDPAGASTELGISLEPVAPSSAAAPAPMEPSPATTGAPAAPLEPSGATTGARGETPPPHVETTQQPGESSWLDAGHAYIERTLFQPVLWVDRFFADERDTEPQRSRSFVRVRQEVNFAQFHHGPGFATSFNVNLKLPSLDQRLERFRIEMAGEARDAFTALLQGDRNPQGEIVATPEQQYGTTDAGVGVRLWETLQTYADMGAGFLLKLPPGAYVRVRFRFVEPLGGAFLAREALTGFWRSDTQFGATGSAELERPIPFALGALWRLSGTTTITQSQANLGFQWAGDLSLLATLFLRIGGQLGFGASGASKSPVDVDVYRTYLRLRRDVFRKWFFVELAPEYQWNATIVPGHRIGFWDVALRFEVQFQARQAAPEKPPPDATPHEPHDPEPRDPPSPGSLPAAPPAG
jgi:hypothetical protein